MTSVSVEATLKAMKYSMENVEFADAVFISHKKPLFLPKGIRFAYIDKLTNIDDFNYKAVYDMGDYIKTDYAMLVHYDGYVVNPDQWCDEFLDYDYIGSPWPLPPEGNTTTYRDIYGNICRVGNSVGIRSKRLMDFPKQENLPWTMMDGRYHEDVYICCQIHHLLEAAGMRIAPLEVARYFAHENMIPEVEGITPFAFHKWMGTNAQYPDFRRKHPCIDALRRLHGRMVNGK